MAHLFYLCDFLNKILLIFESFFLARTQVLRLLNQGPIADNILALFLLPTVKIKFFVGLFNLKLQEPKIGIMIFSSIGKDPFLSRIYVLILLMLIKLTRVQISLWPNSKLCVPVF